MIECNPQGICSRDFYLSGEGYHASIQFGWLSKGTIAVGRNHYQVIRSGVFRSTWTLELQGRVIYTAQYASVFSSTIEITGPSGSATLERASIFGRQMRLWGRSCDLVITPAHAFTRRARINGRSDDFALTAFAFWLVAMQWQQRSEAATTHQNNTAAMQ